MENKPRKPWLAGVLTLLTRGLGHLYAGNPKRGLILFGIEHCLLLVMVFFAVTFTLHFVSLLLAVLIGLSFTIFCVVDAMRIAKEKRENYAVAKYNKWYVYVGYYMVLGFGVSTFAAEGVKQNFIKAYKLPSAAMEPTLLVGDHILVDQRKSAKEPHRGDLVIFEYPEDPTKDFIKRVVAVGGDTVEIRSKILFINGVQVKEPYAVHNEPNTIPANENPRDNLAPKVVPPGSYFMMGDNRDRSYDSRFWGFVVKEKVKGTVKNIYWSWDKEKFAVRWDRLGVRVQ